jgi:hypothetical protein
MLIKVIFDVGDYFVEVKVLGNLVEELTSSVNKLIVFKGSQLGLVNWLSRDCTSWLEVDSVHKKIEFIASRIISSSRQNGTNRD